MSPKAEIKKLTSDSQKARVLSAQLIVATRAGINPTIVVNQKRIKLVRTAQKNVAVNQ